MNIFMRCENRVNLIEQSGFIMLHTMIVVFLLAVFAAAFGRAVWLSNHEASMRTHQIEFTVQSYSKIYETIFKITSDSTLTDELKDVWNVQEKIGDGFSIQVEDESGKLNLTALRSQDKDYEKRIETAVRGLLASKGVSQITIEDFIREVKSKRDAASLEELEIYSSLQSKFKASFDRFLTLHSDGRINVNTASREVLEVLLEAENPFLVKEMLLEREKKPFLDIKDVQGLGDETRKMLSVNSSFFTIKIANAEHNLFKVVVQRSLGETKIISWMEK